MSKYVILKKNTYEVANDVYFNETLEGAIILKDSLSISHPEAEWVIAEIYDERKWYVKLLFWLGRKVDEANKG